MKPKFDAGLVADKMISWIREYFAATPKGTKAVVGVSGGKDSSVVLCACAQALGADRVIAVLMPQGSQKDIDVSYDICKVANVPFVEVNIGVVAEEIYKSLCVAGIELNKIVTVNTPARLRMTVLYAVSAAVGGRVANTSNLSEDYVGYCTKFGDSAGDFGILNTLTASEVKAVGYALKIPERFLEKPPADGLSGFTDEENLGFLYKALDRYIRDGVCDDAEVKEKIDTLYKKNIHKVSPMPIFDINSAK